MGMSRYDKSSVCEGDIGAARAVLCPARLRGTRLSVSKSRGVEAAACQSLATATGARKACSLVRAHSQLVFSTLRKLLEQLRATLGITEEASRPVSQF